MTKTEASHLKDLISLYFIDMIIFYMSLFRLIHTRQNKSRQKNANLTFCRNLILKAFVNTHLEPSTHVKFAFEKKCFNYSLIDLIHNDVKVPIRARNFGFISHSSKKLGKLFGNF